jgi:hypothetical protein
LVFTEQTLDVQHRLNYTSLTGSFRNGRRPLLPDACRPLIRHLNRTLVAILLALFLAAIQFSSARVHHDPTPIHLALWRMACLCAVVRQDAPGGGFFFQPQGEAQA